MADWSAACKILFATNPRILPTLGYVCTMHQATFSRQHLPGIRLQSSIVSHNFGIITMFRCSLPNGDRSQNVQFSRCHLWGMPQLVRNKCFLKKKTISSDLFSKPISFKAMSQMVKNGTKMKNIFFWQIPIFF